MADSDSNQNDNNNPAGADIKMEIAAKDGGENDIIEAPGYASTIENSSSGALEEDDPILQKPSPRIELQQPPAYHHPPDAMIPPAAAAQVSKNILTEDSSTSPTAATSLPLHPSSMTSSPRSAELASSEVSGFFVVVHQPAWHEILMEVF